MMPPDPLFSSTFPQESLELTRDLFIKGFTSNSSKLSFLSHRAPGIIKEGAKGSIIITDYFINHVSTTIKDGEILINIHNDN
jgi:hypothetical protein